NLGDGPVCLRPYRQQQVPILADDIDQQVNQSFSGKTMFWTFGLVVAKRKPHSTIGLPLLESNLLVVRVLGRREIRELDPEAIVDDAVGQLVVVFRENPLQ